MDNFMKYKYAWEKFHSSILTLASDGPFPQRISDAYLYGISLLKKENDIPEPLWEDYEELVSLLTGTEPEAYEGRVSASVNRLGELELNRASELMVGLYDSLCRYMPNHNA
ncbi:hypothetical protein EV102420_10_02080 [Pseudescherichia vulneris NBRC 102420]|uniref:Uncharacterized protein n=1 Tax=Pseudescherichia vulneris NBRC 102420 TaxID=1115515 RepID=A0A090VTC8_PSEVU|nr:hypothetical protein [Pseudescherichia vulneris]GAL58427.1 hypothetical protein EV102420_10_02080 [Pseudescherichia vulneris NBRC 102420]STQ60509.1 Uncharacterised protein [Pseudescherichia vulneris]